MKKMKKEKKDKRVFDAEGNVVKKPFYKRTWFIVLAVFMVFALLLGDDEDAAEEAPEEPIVEEVAAIEEVEETEVEEVEEVEIPEVEEVVEEDEVEESISPEDERKLRTVLALAMMEENFDGVATIDYDEEQDVITILPTDPGFASAILFLQTGDLSMDTWYELRDNYAYMSEELGKAVGEGVIISLLNPSNPDNTILTVVDGVIFYDAFD